MQSLQRLYPKNGIEWLDRCSRAARAAENELKLKLFAGSMKAQKAKWKRAAKEIYGSLVRYRAKRLREQRPQLEVNSRSEREKTQGDQDEKGDQGKDERREGPLSSPDANWYGMLEGWWMGIGERRGGFC